MEHEPVKTPEESGEGLAGSGRRKDQGGFAASDDGPAQALGRSWSVEYGAKPFDCNRMEASQRVRFQVDCGIGLRRVGRHGSLEHSAPGGEEEAKKQPGRWIAKGNAKANSPPTREPNGVQSLSRGARTANEAHMPREGRLAVRRMSCIFRSSTVITQA